ncbi:putative phosphatidylglycerol/phosphatidylinositol transfer protein DDB_G0278295 [Dysidea avara]|uniref:putative phosphatidylglycerol/phosphatidylinositol transfer protein DDB_G0278295 n=1 Tax=Dysidea avara TaxID=196820 RepID=UPI00332D5C5D
MMKPVMKLVFVLDAFCLVLVSAFPLVKDPSEISCTSDFSCANSSFDVTNLTLTFDPDPLEKGKNVTITGTGIINKEITSGEIKVTVTYNDIQLLDKTYDVCELVEKSGDQCPISTGNKTMSITEEIPSDLPNGKYVGTIYGTDQNDDPMICGTVECQVK